MNKNKFAAIIAGLMLGAGAAFSQVNNYSFTFTNGGVVPDANASGFALATNLTDMVGSISDLSISLDVTGGYNGDLYAYLAGPAGFAVLFNRVGVSNNASQFGYSDPGLNITFSSAAINDFHYYQDVAGYSLNGTTWLADGRNIDPQSDPNAFLSASQTATLNSFYNTVPNGTWTLFLADLSSGSQSTLVGWGLDITTVPEPAGLAPMLFLGLAFLCWRKKKLQSSKHS
jgi:subtilisin-like proprotein convertase family protein